ncbi:HEAT repeat protein [Acinetobacter calcoaceticus]|uniref:HEAT repeat protein n=1 Tax=Acinetobacter calcoaceticus TaxID=471 RepID=A0A4R1XNK8_ACICA|nr:HEAT repeat protein [Acinetobacter calcoaceticus]
MLLQYPKIIDLNDEDLIFWDRLNQDDEKIRFITIMKIAEEERDDFLPWLHYALENDCSALVRSEAAKHLEGWENPVTLNVLARALLDTDPEVVSAATQSLSEVKLQQSARILAPYLQLSAAPVKIAILQALRPLRDISLYEQIAQHVDHDDVLVRREAVSALSWLQQERAILSLSKIAQYDLDLETRRIALGGLAYCKHIIPEVIAALSHGLEEGHWQLRQESALTIGKLNLNELEVDLIALLEDQYWQVRIAIVRSLGRLKSKNALAGLTLNFNFEISNLRKEVALALGEIKGNDAEQLLLEHLKDPDPEVRKAIRIGLNQIQEFKDAH